jgi:hypothetical protein
MISIDSLTPNFEHADGYPNTFSYNGVPLLERTTGQQTPESILYSEGYYYGPIPQTLPQEIRNVLYLTPERFLRFKIWADYIEHKDIVEQPFFRNGNLRLLWWNDLVSRLADFQKSKLWRTNRMMQTLPPLVHLLPADKKNLFIANLTIAGDYKGAITTLKVFSATGIVNLHTSKLGDFVPVDMLLPLCLANPLRRANGFTVFVEENCAITTLLFQGASLTIPKAAFDELVIRDLIKECDDCGTWELSENMIGSTCPLCIPEGLTSLALTLKEYTARAPASFPFKEGKTKGSKFLGVELEYELENTPQKTGVFLVLKHLHSHAIVKRDGSLTNGLEICSAPAHLDVHLTSFKPFFEDKKAMSSLLSKTTTGMHVHVDKRKMNFLTIGKLHAFMSAKEHVVFLENIAGRASNSYAATGRGGATSDPFLQRGLSDRYAALNLSPRDTLEFRLFATPSSYEEFKKNMEFVEALVTWCAPGNRGINESTQNHFIAYVDKHKGEYPSLYAFLLPLASKGKKENHNVYLAKKQKESLCA